MRVYSGTDIMFLFLICHILAFLLFRLPVRPYYVVNKDEYNTKSSAQTKDYPVYVIGAYLRPPQ